MQTYSSLRALIVGGGLGGLAAATALRQAGHRVTVVEQAQSFGEVGAGLQLVPNATRMLRRLGVLDDVGLRPVTPQATMRRRWQDGDILGELPLGAPIERHYHSPYWNAHRADLHAVLLRAATDISLPGVPAVVEAGVQINALEDRADGGVVAIDQRGIRWEGDFLIGADGIHSAVRHALFGADAPVQSGDDAYRALIPADALKGKAGDLLEATKVTIWLGPDRHAIHYWLRGRTLLNLVAIVPASGQARESWSATGDQDALLAEFDGWDPRLREILTAAPVLGRWTLQDRAPLDQWSVGRVCLLGDACHPMLPYQSQGAAQTLEDAVCLGEELTDLVDATKLPERFGRYAARRKDRATRIQSASFGNRAVFHLPDGDKQRERDAGLKGRQGDFKSYDWAWSEGF